MESANNIVTYLADNTSTQVSTSAAATSCDEYKQNLTSGLMPYQILVFLNPTDERIWMDRDDVWRSIFKIYIGLLGSIYLMLGLFSVALLIKKDCVRLSTKTFFAVYSTIAVLGFSRALLLVLDPYNLLGYISQNFHQWIIITRLLGSFGFPSLVASYTLMVFTLLKIAKANPGKQWYHKWRFVIPIVVSPYVIAIGAEVIGYLAKYPGLLSVIICEMTFALWGITILITYLIAGGRLMHQLRKRERNTVRMSGSGITRSAEELATQNDFAAQEYQRHHRHNRRTARKIAIITYVTVFMTFLYSLLTFGNIMMVCLFLFKDCLAHMGARGNSAAWLGLHISTRATEITLATIMLYSITDISGVVKFMYRMFVAMCCCKKMRVTECSRQKHPLAAGGTLNNNNASYNNTLNQTLSPGPHSHREALIGTDQNTNNSNGVIAGDESLMSSGGEEPEETTTTVTIFQEKVDLSGMASLGDSGIQLEATEDGQENLPALDNNGDNIDGNHVNMASNSPRTFLLHASKGESSSSIDSAVTQENSQLAQQLQQTSKKTTAPIVVPRTKAESTEALAQTEIHMESQGDDEERHLNSAYVPYTSPDITLEHTVVEVETQTTDKACQTDRSEPAPSSSSGSGKPMPKPRKFAPKSPRERREKLRQQKQLPQTSFSSKLKRQQTV